MFQLCRYADWSQQAAPLQCCRRTSPVAVSKARIACERMARRARVQAETQAFQGEVKAALATYQTAVAKTKGKDVDLVSGLATTLVEDGKPQQARCLLAWLRHRRSSNRRHRFLLPRYQWSASALQLLAILRVQGFRAGDLCSLQLNRWYGCHLKAQYAHSCIG